jgi:hypothetical protein
LSTTLELPIVLSAVRIKKTESGRGNDRQIIRMTGFVEAQCDRIVQFLRIGHCGERIQCDHGIVFYELCGFRSV